MALLRGRFEKVGLLVRVVILCEFRCVLNSVNIDKFRGSNYIDDNISVLLTEYIAVY